MKNTVHVMGPPEDENGQPRGMLAHERHCDDPDRGEEVVFHVRSERFGDGYRCSLCGETSTTVSA
jgi:hypothetical protein